MKKDIRVKLKMAMALVLVVLAGVLIFQNVEEMQVRFLFITLSMPRAALLTITLLMGIAIGILVSLLISGRRLSKNLGCMELEDKSGNP